jgi:hypothetical protein
MATLEQLQGSSGPFAADSAADALRVEVTCAARYIRDLESAKMVKKTGRAGDRFARQRYVVTAAWTKIAISSAEQGVALGRCAGCGRGGRDLLLFRRRFWCPSCLHDPSRTDGGCVCEADCPVCGRRLDVSETRSEWSPGKMTARLVATCYRCQIRGEVEAKTVDEAWSILHDRVREIRGDPPTPRPSAPAPAVGLDGKRGRYTGPGRIRKRQGRAPRWVSR